MYQVTCDDVIIFDLRADDRIVLSPTLNLETGKNGTFDFTIPPANPGYELIKQRVSIIKVFQIDKINNNFISTEIYKGTSYSVEEDFYKRKKVQTEGELSFFNDSKVRPYDFQGDVEEYFKRLIVQHNNQVDSFKQFKIGNCTVTDSNDYITRANKNYPTTKEEIETKLINLLGGHFEVREENGNRYIDYLTKYERVNTQVIRFGKNMLDITKHIKSSDVKTRIIPLGYQNEETEEKLTIKSVNDDIDYVEDEASIALFGIIVDTVEFENVTLSSNLKTKGEQYLQTVIGETVSINITAADLHEIDVNIEAFRVGDMVRVVSIPHNLDKYFLLSKLQLKLDDIKSSKMTLGATFKTYTQKQLESQKNIQTAVKNVTDMSTSLESVQKQVNTVVNTVTKLPDDYVTNGEFTTYKQGIAEEVQNIESAIVDVNEDVKLMMKDLEKVDLSEYIKAEELESLELRIELLENKINETEIEGGS